MGPRMGRGAREQSPTLSSGVSDALHENLNPKREIDGKSERELDPEEFTRRPTHEYVSRPVDPTAPWESPPASQPQVSWLAGRLPPVRVSEHTGLPRVLRSCYPNPWEGESSRSNHSQTGLPDSETGEKLLGLKENYTFQNFSSVRNYI